MLSVDGEQQDVACFSAIGRVMYILYLAIKGMVYRSFAK